MKQINQIRTIAKDLTSEGYLGACGIDPDIKIADRISGMICPSNYEKVLDKEDILWLEPNDVNNDIYYYTADGEFGKIYTDTRISDSGGTLYFNEGDSVRMTDLSVDLGEGNQISVAGWIKPSASTDQRSPIAQIHGWYFQVYENNRLATYWYGRSPAGYHYSSVNSVPMDEWSHVVVVWSTSDVKFYINGSLDSTISSIYGAGNTYDWIYLGYEYSTRRYKGVISDLRVYNKALSSSEISSIYNGENVVSGMVGYWPLNEGSGTTAYDASLNNNNGSIIGASWSSSNLRESFTSLGSFYGAKGNGLKYHNNYYYIAVGEDIHRYGPLDEEPSLELNWWSSLSEKENEFNILAQGGEKEINSTTKRVLQSIPVAIDVSKLKVVLKNTGYDTYYNIRARIYEKDTTQKVLPEPFGSPVAEYNVDIPKGDPLGEATIPATSLENEFRSFVFDFEEVEAVGPFVIVIDTVDDLIADQSFAIRCSEFGDVYPGGMMSSFTDSWDANQTKYDTKEDSFTYSGAGETLAHSYTIQTKKPESVLDKNFNVKVHISQGAATCWSLTLKVKRDGVSESLIPPNFTSNQDTVGDFSTWVNKSGSLNITILPSQGLMDGDILEIYGSGTDDDLNPKTVTVSRQAFAPYFYWLDTTSEEDLALEIFTETLADNTLTDKTYPVLGKYEMPNHAMFESLGVVYIADTQDNRGVVHSFQTSTSMVLKDVVDGDFQFGDVIRGRESRTTATIVKVIKSITPDGARIELGLNKIYGVFQEDEVVESLSRDGEAIVESVVRGEMTLVSEMNVLFLDIEEEPVGFAGYSSHIAVLTNKERARIRLWDGIAEDPYKPIPLAVPVATAITNHNGVVYVWGGDNGGDNEGYSVSVYQGGDYVQQILYVDNGLKPLMGAIGQSFNRLSWGSNQTYPEERGCVWAIGSRTEQSGWHNIASAGNQVSALLPRIDDASKIIATDQGVFLKGGEYNSVWRSEMMSFGRPFDIKSVKLPLSKELEDGKITITLFYDNGTKSAEYEVEPGTYENEIIHIHPEAEGIVNFFIEAKIETETFVAIMLPIVIEYKINE